MEKVQEQLAAYRDTMGEVKAAVGRGGVSMEDLQGWQVRGLQRLSNVMWGKVRWCGGSTIDWCFLFVGGWVGVECRGGC